MNLIKKSKLRNFFIPHHGNDFRPYSTRHYTLIAFSVLLLVLNFFIFPSMGVSSGNVLASNIDLDQLISLANRERSAQGLGPLSKNENLSKAAFAKGNDMLKKQYWAHFGPSGESPWQFILGSGYNYVYAGENLAKDFSTAIDAHLAWMKSPTHRANIMNANFRDVGLSMVTGKYKDKDVVFIIQMFGSKVTTPNIQTSQPTAKATTPAPTKVATPAPTATSTPVPTPDISSYTPKLTNPEDITLSNDASVKLEGEAALGNTILVYSNGQLVGELPKGGNPFTINVQLFEELNKVTIQSKETLTGKVSQPSNPIEVVVDQTPPDTSKIYATFYEVQEGILIEIKSEEEIEKVDIQTEFELKEFIKQDSDFYYLLRDAKVGKITLTFYDKIGNTSTLEYNLDDQSKSTSNIPTVAGITTTPTASATWFSFATRIGQRELINISIIAMIMALILLDSSVLLKNGLKREFASHPSFHFALIMICIVGVITI